MPLQHFILTRFNLLLWGKDKNGHKVRSVEWLDHRFALFERFCLPSILAQTNKSFEWIVLFDIKTPDIYKQRITDYQGRCPQLIPVYVEPKNGRYFASIFKAEVSKRVIGERVITTYLDNDDSVAIGFVEDIQRRASNLPDETFITYTEGYQFYTDYNYVMRISYPRNHFVSVVEGCVPSKLKTIYGYGSHFFINKIPGVRIDRVEGSRLWCEVIHEKNKCNDAYYIHAKMVDDPDLLRNDFAVDITVQSGIGLYLFRFLPRYARTFVTRVKHKLFGMEW